MELINVTYNGNGIDAQDYSIQDQSLIISNTINSSFGDKNDYIESFIYDDNNNLLNSNYNLSKYTPVNSSLNAYSSIKLNPDSDVIEAGFDRGSLNIQYNFLKNLFGSSYGNFYWIKEISSTRKELKLASQTISDSAIKTGFNQFQIYSSQKNYYSDFYLNFADNNLLIAVNVAYVEDNNGSYLLIKLYEPLPSNYDIKSSLWLVDKIADSVSYNVNIQVESVQQQLSNALRGPNFKIDINQKLGLTTNFYNYNSLFGTQITSSFQQLSSYYQDQSININVDYSNFSNFIHFSSATERLNNFVYKIELIESYNAQIAAQKLISSSQNSVTSSIQFLNNSINNIIQKFDNYEYYLYYTSASFTWPKSNTTQPYSLYSVTSSQVINWLGNTQIIPTNTTQSLLYSASYYDANNKDNLVFSIPQYLQDDPSNIPYTTFLSMIGQHFDNIWIYYKDVTNRYKNTNNPTNGISLDCLKICVSDKYILRVYILFLKWIFVKVWIVYD